MTDTMSSLTNTSFDPKATPELQRILVVDDDPVILKLLKSILGRAGYRVTTCQAADAALRLLSQGSLFDCLITDAMMPVMTGYDLVHALKANSSFHDIPIVMLTRKSDRNDVKKALDAGVTDYVLKPIDEFLLLDKIELCLKTRQENRKVREVRLNSAETKTEANFDIRLVAIRESGLVTRFPFNLPAGVSLRLDSSVFKEVGIPAPLMRMVRSEYLPQKEVPAFSEFPFEIEFSFVGIEEASLKKIRAWLQRQEILRKK
jgi:CheY-like chemotaxis protein